MVKPVVLVVGAAEGSLGGAVVRELETKRDRVEYVYVGGIGDEPNYMDLRDTFQVSEILADAKPDIVICTAGINLPTGITSENLLPSMNYSFGTNVTAVIGLLYHFIHSPTRAEVGASSFKKFVAISSNSARIARRNSIAYCASKAALSMALRVAARELAQLPVLVWGYEPGLLDGTPMTREVTAQFTGPLGETGGAMHRMPGIARQGIHPAELAQRIVHDVLTATPAYNGLLFPFDAGEQ